MRNLKRRFVALLLVCMFTVFGAMSVQAAEMSAFPYQNRNSFTARYTRAIQVMMLNYNSTTRAYIKNSGGVDASYGPATSNAVIAFQASRGLSADGSCGPATWRALRTSLIRSSVSGKYVLYRGPYSYGNNMRQYNSSGGAWYCYSGSWIYVG